MGFFPLAGTIWSILNPLRVKAAGSRWPVVLWRRSFQYIQQVDPTDNPSRLTVSRPLFQSRATSNHSADRASESIQRAALRRRHSRTASTLRRWMLPTVERGPPVHISV
jgi:hypothetical protein